MIEVQPVFLDSLEQVYAMIREQGHWVFPQRKDLFDRLMNYPWRKPEWPLGFSLLVDGNMEGFIGIIFCERMIGGRCHTLGNLTTWVVNPKYRSQSLLLLSEALKVKSDAFTDFTPTANVYRLLKKSYSFFDMDSGYRLMTPLSGLSSLFSGMKYQFTFELDSILARVDLASQRIARDHAACGCGVVLAYCGQEDVCMVVYQILSSRNIPYGQILHISDKNIFFKCMHGFFLRMALREKVPILIANERLLESERVHVGLRKTRSYNIMLRSQNLRREDVDDLYNECVLLNIRS
ncbi:MAG: hypothetical protein HQL07_10475 [Nitrospirae bacterium]|nr:hypothetical protein [Magnetococcales bacterium]HAT50479.1 hypothetical protein [Alphaproteobacteria bacterium]